MFSGFLPEVFVSFWIETIVSQFSVSPYLTKGMRKSFLIFLVFDGLNGEIRFALFKKISQWGFQDFAYFPHGVGAPTPGLEAKNLLDPPM